MKRILVMFISAFLLFMPIQSVCAEEKPQLAVGSVSASEGETADVPVNISNNSGIIALSFWVDYDKESLKLTGADDGRLFSGASFTTGGDVSEVPFKIILEDALAHENHVENGTAVVLHFEVLDTASSGFSEVSLKIDEGNTFDTELEDVEFDVINGGVDISDKISIETDAVNSIDETASETEKVQETEDSTYAEKTEENADESDTVNMSDKAENESDGAEIEAAALNEITAVKDTSASSKNKKSSALPIIIGISAIAVIGFVIFASVMLKKKK